LGQPWWLNNTGLVQFAGTKVIPVAIQLDGMLSYKPYKVSVTNSGTTNTSISLSDYQNSLMTMHDKRVWLFGPSATYGSFTGVAGIRTAYVFDTRLQAWSTISLPASIGKANSGGAGDITGACSIQTATDTESLYIGAANGQVYRYKDYCDSRFEITAASINTTTNKVSISSSEYTSINTQIGVTATVIITSSGNSQLALNSTWKLTLTGANDFTLQPVSSGPILDFTDSTVFSFRTAETISWLYNSRLYGQTYSEGVSYYSKNRPSQLDLHIETKSTGSTINWSLFGAGGTRTAANAIVASNSTMTAKQYTFAGNTSRVIRGVPRYMNDINWQIILSGNDSFYPFRIYGAHLHMIESGITRHR